MEGKENRARPWWPAWFFLLGLYLAMLQGYVRIIMNTSVWACKMDIWPSFTLPEPIQKWTISKELYVPALKLRTVNLFYAKDIEKGYDWKLSCEGKKQPLVSSDFEPIGKGSFIELKPLGLLKRLDNWELLID